ncbi:uncharacterized protein LOC131887579 isoform X2 [Tigriopus californicus]|uniref:uncharacterized protein LOC131887579 isoform X2 n=1 Tax=Tigriopus californicus TaxID=6832 RepID=UPI0027DA7A4F|nr:uncharacterized protein LOC131887579 isoform X2 [Tigriopus californicus]
MPRDRSYSPNISSPIIEAEKLRQSKAMIPPNRTIFLSLGVLFTLTGVIALIAYSVLIAYIPDFWFVRNYYFNIWTSIFILYFGIQVLIEAKSGPWFDSKVCKFLDVSFSAYCLLCFLASSALFFIFGRIDLGVWYIVLVALMAMNIVVVLVPMNEVSKVGMFGDADENDPGNVSSCCTSSLRVMNWFFRGIFFILVGLATISAVLHGLGVIAFWPENGKFLNLHLDQDQMQKVHYVCEGSSSNEAATVIFESSASHGLADWIGILKANAEKRRICVWDKPGLGWSDYLYGYQKEPSNYYGALLRALKEAEPNYQPPYVGVGWGGGGETLWKFAISQPEAFKSLVLYEVAPPAINLKIRRNLESLDEDTYSELKKINTRFRHLALRLMNVLLVPMGLSSLLSFFESTVYHPDHWSHHSILEKSWFMATEKTWISQATAMQELGTNMDNSTFTTRISSNIDVHLIFTQWTESEVKNIKCKSEGVIGGKDEEECKYAVDFELALAKAKEDLIPNPRKRIRCREQQCGLAYGIFENPQFLLDNIPN